MLLIGLGNKARQGKDYVANLWKEFDHDVQLFSFAKALKLYCKANHDTLESKWQLAHQTKQKPAWKEDPIYGCTPILQWFGTLKRETEPDYWVNIVDAEISKEAPNVAIVTDVRFPNEAEWVKNRGGWMVEIIRRNADGTRYHCPTRDPYHISETALDDYSGWDFTIMVKDGDLEALESKAAQVYNNIKYDYIVKESGLSVPDATGYSAADLNLELPDTEIIF